MQVNQEQALYFKCFQSGNFDPAACQQPCGNFYFDKFQDQKFLTVDISYNQQGRNHMEDRCFFFEMKDLIDEYQKLQQNQKFQNNWQQKPANFNFGVYSVIDGHGGAEVAQTVLDQIFQIFMRNLSQIDYNSLKQYFINLLREVLKQLEKFLLDKYIEDKTNNVIMPDNSMGACINITIIYQDNFGKHLISANLGDTRSAIVEFYENQTYEGVQVTIDHKAKDNYLEQERVRRQEGQIFQDRVDGTLAVTRALADFLLKYDEQAKTIKKAVSSEPDIHIIDLGNEHKYYILASDGLWDVLSNNMTAKEVQSYEQKNKSIKGVSNQLYQKAIDTKDNITIMVVQL